MEIKTTTLAARSVVSACPSVAGLRGIGVSVAPLAKLRFRGERRAAEFFGGVAFGGEVFGYEGLAIERPTKASAAVAAEVSSVRVAAMAAADAGQKQKSQKQNSQQHSIQHHTMWAFRGPDPWRSPT
ncbi:hypothetical protein MTQ01_08695 [Streptomyces sp. XM4193]|uniref:hypothetical protein n=1 Tax=Streptomyces sp. XM4193 TaxID=2929782 RepID=UPI001FF845D1|nr:hypothetical protein [Streptomyces sp. XM4193]MCK1796081.1 hypothetical protein [Streptomyces sp. XM4193]